MIVPLSPHRVGTLKIEILILKHKKKHFLKHKSNFNFALTVDKITALLYLACFPLKCESFIQVLKKPLCSNISRNSVIILHKNIYFFGF